MEPGSPYNGQTLGDSYLKAGVFFDKSVESLSRDFKKTSKKS